MDSKIVWSIPTSVAYLLECTIRRVMVYQGIMKLAFRCLDTWYRSLLAGWLELGDQFFAGELQDHSGAIAHRKRQDGRNHAG
jgi:hypothetical protein